MARLISQRGQSDWSRNGSQWTEASGPASPGNGHTSMDGDMQRLARALGWFSLGLGFAQIAAPGKVAQLIGVNDDDETIAIMRVLGVREIASGLGILTQAKPTPWLWARVGGDAIDLALLRRALSSPRTDHNRVAAATAAVGMEAHGHGPMYAFDRAMHAARLETDRPLALREAIKACRNGGTVSVIGAYGGYIDRFPIGSVMNRSLTIRSGQCHVQRYMRPLLAHIQNGDIDPTFIITHTLPLEQAPHGYDIFKNKRDNCEKVILKA